MYISIDKDHMRFLHKHAMQHVVSNLVEIEAPHVATSVIPCDHMRYFNTFTDLELFSLYRSATGLAPGGYSRQGLMALCLAAAEQVPEIEAEPWEVDLQLRAILDGDTGRYRYVRGSMKPAPVDELFEDEVIQVRVNPEEVARARILREPQGTAATAPLAHTPIPAPTGRDRTLAGARVPGTAPHAPTPRGAGRERIWACADRMWEEAGKPTTVATVLELRKKMMDELEKEGTKRTSASSELGNWMKVRVITAK